jgi:GNAT superfamily N-acetyltransferase
MDNFTYKIMTGQQLYDSLVDYSNDDAWHKFEPLKKRIRYLGTDIVPNYFCKKNYEHYFFTAFENDKIIGMLKLKTGGEDSYGYPGYKNWISFCSIDKDYRGKGISVILIDMLFKFAKEKNINILTSGYSDLGFYRLKKNFALYAEKYGVDFKDDREKAEFPDED